MIHIVKSSDNKPDGLYEAMTDWFVSKGFKNWVLKVQGTKDGRYYIIGEGFF
jgi:hypothetical protein